MVHREPMLILQLEGPKLDGRPGQPGWEESILFRFLVTIIIVIHNGLHFTMGASLVTQMVKNTPVNARYVTDMGSVPGLGRSPGGGNGNPL